MCGKGDSCNELQLVAEANSEALPMRNKPKDLVVVLKFTVSFHSFIEEEFRFGSKKPP